MLIKRPSTFTQCERERPGEMPAIGEDMTEQPTDQIVIGTPTTNDNRDEKRMTPPLRIPLTVRANAECADGIGCIGCPGEATAIENKQSPSRCRNWAF